MNKTLEGGYRLNEGITMPEDRILVSVVTIVYNGDQFLEQTILSVLNQTYSNIEYIIIDGGSTDSTLDIIRKYEDKIAYWKSEPDKGISDAFNKGIDLATGTLVGILNADDWLEPDAIESVVAKYKPGCVLHGNMQYWNPDGSKGMYVMPNAALLPQEMTINHPTVFIETETYKSFGAFSTDYKLAMDYHLLLRLHKSKLPFIHIDKTIANMRSGGASGNWINSYNEVRKAKDEILGKSINHLLTYYWQVLRRRTSEAISDSPLSFINKIYRRYFSPMRKQ